MSFKTNERKNSNVYNFLPDLHNYPSKFFKSLRLYSKGISVETIKAAENGLEAYKSIMIGSGDSDELKERCLPMLHEMALDIERQHKRLGGNFAIAQAVFNRSQRDQIKKDLGPNLNFIVLNVSKECQSKRVAYRHGSDGQGAQLAALMEKFYDLYEPAGEDEKNAYNIDITEDMSVEDVIKKVLKIVENIS